MKSTLEWIVLVTLCAVVDVGIRHDVSGLINHVGGITAVIAGSDLLWALWKWGTSVRMEERYRAARE